MKRVTYKLQRVEKLKPKIANIDAHCQSLSCEFFCAFDTSVREIMFRALTNENNNTFRALTNKNKNNKWFHELIT
jgi:hypothetical protein